MKLLLINSVCGTGSTGRICVEIAREYEQNGYEVKIAYGRNEGTIPADARKYAVRVGSDIDVYAHVLYTRITDKHGLASKRVTRRFLEWADDFNPDILWLHNIHGYYINYEMLFEWIRQRPQMQVKWTLHDCWAFTGHCPHYIYVGCGKWENGCDHCPRLHGYPSSYLMDNSCDNYARKRTAFVGLPKLTLITPSHWLASELRKSFLCDYPVEVSYNKINTGIFKPTKSDFRARNSISDNTRMILAVSGVWNETKGLPDLLELDNRLRIESGTQSDKNIETQPGKMGYKIIIVGLTTKQVKQINNSNPDIICIAHTESTEELAGIYTAADVFVNPTYEDNYPTVNLEAEACGTPVITYDTGGCSETIHLTDSRVVPHGVDNLLRAIRDIR